VLLKISHHYGKNTIYRIDKPLKGLQKICSLCALVKMVSACPYEHPEKVRKRQITYP
jgi:hypothetical protein